MFHFGVYFHQTATQLVVIDPISIFPLFFAALFGLLPVYNAFVERPLRRTKFIVHIVIAIVFFGFAPDHTTLTLDRQTQTGTLRSFTFYHFATNTFPLSSLVSASVRTGSTTGTILLQFDDGNTRTMSALNQMGGKDQAVYAINRFLAGDVSNTSR